MTILEIVQTKLGDSSLFVNPTLLALAIEEVEQAILNYCNISKVPDALRFTWANMVVDLVRYEQAMSEGPGDKESVDLNNVSSIKMGDTSINLGGSNSQYSKAVNSHKANLDELIMNNREQLKKFRRMVW